jgi:hypothetical protein
MYMLQFLPEASPCGRIMDAIERNQNPNLIDAEGADWSYFFYSSCAMYYFSKNMYECMMDSKQAPGSLTPKEFTDLFFQVDNECKDKRITEEMRNKYPQLSKAIDCMQKSEEQWKIYNERLQEVMDKPEKVAAVAFKEFEYLAQNTQFSVGEFDTKDMMRKKVESVENGPCKKYSGFSMHVTPDNVLNSALIQTDLGLCMLSTLCASEMQKCLNSGKQFMECQVDPEYQMKFRRCLERVSAMDQM